MSSATAVNPAAKSLPAVSPAAVIMGGALLAAFVGLFFRWFRVQHFLSFHRPEDWGHAYFIPVISGYLIWNWRRELASVRPTVFWPGLAPLLAGIMTYSFFLATPASSHMVQGWAIVLSLFGLVLLLLGPAAMRFLFIPIAYLVFAVTISEKIMTGITFQLQLLASQGAWVLLNLIGAVAGFHTDVEGNTLTVVDSTGGLHPLNVAEACSGMRMVIAFYALGAAVAVLSCRFWWQRVALLLLAAPVALLMNVVRVTVLGVATLFDSDLAAGGAHTLIGTLLLVPGLALFLLVVWALNKLVDEEGAAPAMTGAKR